MLKPGKEEGGPVAVLVATLAMVALLLPAALGLADSGQPGAARGSGEPAETGRGPAKPSRDASQRAERSAKTSKGWGPAASFVGRYHVRIESVAAAGAARAQSAGRDGVFTAVLPGVQAVASSSARPTGGELTLFMQEEFPHAPLVPAGILNLRTSKGTTELLYLSSLTSSGNKRDAKVNGGAFVGPVLGSFSGTTQGPGRITAKVVAKGVATFTASFVRFSKSPHP